MAGFILKVKPSDLEKTSNQLSTEIKNFQKEWNSIKTTVQKSSSYWEGDASDLHQKYLKSLETDLDTILKRLNEHPTDLLKMAGLYKETEKTNVDIANTLAGDVIS